MVHTNVTCGEDHLIASLEVSHRASSSPIVMWLDSEQ